MKFEPERNVTYVSLGHVYRTDWEGEEGKDFFLTKQNKIPNFGSRSWEWKHTPKKTVEK